MNPVRHLSVFLGSLLIAVSACAQSFPTKPIKFVVGFSAGGPADAGARIVASGLTKSLGQQVVVDNRTGASGRIATDFVSRSEADGYTVLVATADMITINPHLYKMPLDPMKVLEPVAPMGNLPLVMAVHTGLGVSESQGLANAAKANGKGLTYGSWGIGSLGHIGGVLFDQIAGTAMLHVPFPGGAPAQSQLMARQIDMLITQVPWAEQAAKAGKVTIVGLTSPKRSTLYPSIPTLAEQGLANYAVDQWTGFYVPKGTPPAVKQALTKAIAEFVASEAGQAQLKAAGFEPLPGNADMLAKMGVGDFDRWGKLIQDRKIVAE